MNERQLESKQGYAEKITSSFQQKDNNAVARCELQKVQFLNSSQKISRVTSGPRSPDKPNKLIVIKDKDSVKKFMLNNIKIDNTHHYIENPSRQKLIRAETSMSALVPDELYTPPQDYDLSLAETQTKPVLLIQKQLA